MNSSGIKRGLATTAIAALAITGVPAIANAATLEQQEPANTIDLKTLPATAGVASVKNDGTNTSVSLVATAGSGVEFVSFYNSATPAAANLIGTATRGNNGEFQIEWTPGLGAANVVTAAESDVSGTPDTSAGAAPSDSATTVALGTAASLEVAPRGQAGYFQQPTGGVYATAVGANGGGNLVFGLTGTQSSDAVPALVAADSEGVLAANSSFTTDAANGAATTSWFGTVNLDPTDVTPGDATVDQVLPVVEAAANGSRDAQGYTVYSQTINNISVTTGSFDNAAQTGTVTITVTDQNGQPVSGVNIGRTNAGGNAASNSVGVTNGRGQVVLTSQQAGSYTFYADASNAAGFTNGVDRQASATLGAQRANSIAFESRDGNAFDIDEYSAGDTRVRVLDAAGNPVAGETFFYNVTFDAFADGVPTATTRQQTAVTDANGYANIRLPLAESDFAGTPGTTSPSTAQLSAGGTYTVNGFVNRDGSAPGQDAADLALTAASFKAGESIVDFDGPANLTRQFGTTQTFTGTVELADGTPLVGRTLDISYTPTGDSALSATQPTGTTRLSNTSARVVTQAGGTFSVSVTDPAATTAPQTDETAVLRAVGTATVGNTNPATNGIGTDANDQVTITFAANAAASGVTLSPNYGGNGDQYLELIGGQATPGRPVAFEVNLTNSTGDPLAGQQVTLTTSNGFFVEYNDTTPATPVAAGDLTADPAPAAGGNYGEFKSLGQSIVVTTDAQGRATVVVGIERDAGFDDDGIVDATIRATSGGATNANPINVRFQTTAGFEALNPGSVDVQVDEEANVGDEVPVNVYAKDQFGNLVKDSVVVADNTTDAGFEAANSSTPRNGSQTVASQFLGEDATLDAVADTAVEQTITATWTQASNKYQDSNPNQAGFQPGVVTVANNSVTDSATINWTDVDFGDYDITLTSSPEGDVKVNAPVTETVTVVDADGNPVAGVVVEFTRQGPGDQAGQDVRVTNAQGQASYTFSSATVGTATVIAVVSDGQAGGESETLTDTVNFVTGVEVIRANLSANNNGAKPDRLKVTTGKAAAAGAVVKFFRIKANGGSVQVGQAVLGADGSVKKNVKDINGKRFTKYFARVLPTDATLGDRSNNTRVR